MKGLVGQLEKVRECVGRAQLKLCYGASYVGFSLRRANSTPDYVAVTGRCLRRLNQKGNRLLLAGQHPNKVKVNASQGDEQLQIIGYNGQYRA